MKEFRVHRSRYVRFGRPRDFLCPGLSFKRSEARNRLSFIFHPSSFILPSSFSASSQEPTVSNHLPIPSDLQHLIEKRTRTDRRKKRRRSGSRRQVDLGPLGALESGGGLDQVDLEDRRVSAERRKVPERRKRARRKSS